MILESYAKLNLYLEVLNVRADKYHNLKTVFERINLCDKLTLKTRPDQAIRLSCNLPSLTCDKTNLAYRSAKLLQDSFKIKQGVEIRIVKRIPVASGLGGGSSNAASVLVGLNKLWNLNLAQKKLFAFARKIGSDVPFFIYNRPYAIGTERGDRLKPLTMLNGVRFWHILVVPKIKVSTPFIYKEWDRLKKGSLTPPFLQNNLGLGQKRAGLTKQDYDVKISILGLRRKDLFLREGVLFNSLEEVTSRLYPEVRRIRERLVQLGAKSILMSGSGPAVFAIVSSRKEAQDLSQQLKEQNKLWQVFVTRTI